MSCLCQIPEQMELALFISQAALQQLIGHIQDILNVPTTGFEVKLAH